MQLDHVVIAVNDLDAAISAYRDLGFLVARGGRHAAGTTENALIGLQDGAYLELIALTGAAVTDADATDFAQMFRLGSDEGFVGFALYTSTLDVVAAGMRARGLAVGDLLAGQRVTGEGVPLRWQMAFIPGTASPFFIADDTPRAHRVPQTPERTDHPNGVTGVAELAFVSEDIDKDAAFFRNATGIAPRMDGGRAAFDLAGCALTVAPAVTDAMRTHVANRPGAPYSLTLRTASPPAGEPAPLGARLIFRGS